MSDIATAKDGLRARMRAVRKAIPADERASIDAKIAECVCTSPEFQSADVVLTYLSMGAEVETRAIIERAWELGKVVALPRCVGPRQMRWFKVTSLDSLELSPFGVEEPYIDEAAEQTLSTGERMVAIVPGMAFDDEGYRLGYGGGFYDTFLADFEGPSIGLCRSAQHIPSLKAEGVIGEYDLPVDLVISE
ncbi:MAG: 5-formyltetrahydrofolate cyclo-ligase [Eggerthellaceae bacterium]|nr:5-formyltetrahydrofolate cyclo-ligase [Eggerthellaceae bacterium]